MKMFNFFKRNKEVFGESNMNNENNSLNGNKLGENNKNEFVPLDEPVDIEEMKDQESAFEDSSKMTGPERAEHVEETNKILSGEDFDNNYKYHR